MPFVDAARFGLVPPVIVNAVVLDAFVSVPPGAIDVLPKEIDAVSPVFVPIVLCQWNVIDALPSMFA